MFNWFAASFSIGLIAAISSVSQAAYQFSAYEFARNPARVDNQMRIEMSGRTALRSFRFVGRVGGVNFEGIVDLSGVSTVDIDYVATNPDGRRAIVNIDGAKFTIPLYDWQLKPIAEYADSPYTAVVSIFGQGPNLEKFRYIDYHPAFEDTHIGMRLLQADILLMDPITFSEAPSEDGKKVYMAGEARERSLQARLSTALLIHEFLSTDKFQAWVLTDTDVEPVFDEENGVLKVDLTPYYYFWRLNSFDNSASVDKYNSLVEKVRPLLNAFEVAHQRNDVGRLQELTEILEPKLAEIEALRDKIEMFEPEVIEVANLTNKFREKYDVVRNSAPFIYHAVELTAQYAAFFRGVKAVDPVDWSDFVQELSEEIFLEPVETPNQFAR